jgi:multidrug efflux pump subunit AcrB
MAAAEVFLPVLSGTLTTLAPFVPLLFWPGVIGEFMFFLPMTLIITLLASLLVAYIINPVFAVDFMKPEDHSVLKPSFDKSVKRNLLIFLGIALLAYLINFGLGNLVVFVSLLYLFNHFYLSNTIKNFQTNVWPSVQKKYASLLRKALNWPRAILLGTLGLFLLTFLLIAIVPPKIVFFPKGDPNFVYVYVQLPVGTDQAYTNEVLKKVEADVTKVVGRDNKDVTSIISNVTIGVTDPQSEDQGQYPNMGKVTVAFAEFGKRTEPPQPPILENISVRWKSSDLLRSIFSLHIP